MTDFYISYEYDEEEMRSRRGAFHGYRELWLSALREIIRCMRRGQIYRLSRYRRSRRLDRRTIQAILVFDEVRCLVDSIEGESPINRANRIAKILEKKAMEFFQESLTSFFENKQPRLGTLATYSFSGEVFMDGTPSGPIQPMPVPMTATEALLMNEQRDAALQRSIQAFQAKALECMEDSLNRYIFGMERSMTTTITSDFVRRFEENVEETYRTNRDMVMVSDADMMNGPWASSRPVQSATFDLGGAPPQGLFSDRGDFATDLEDFYYKMGIYRLGDDDINTAKYRKISSDISNSKKVRIRAVNCEFDIIKDPEPIHCGGN